MLIVFPIIPWGYLWQRPQQILSQLAARGYTTMYLAVADSAKRQNTLSPILPGIFHLWLKTPDLFDLHENPWTAEKLEEFSEQIVSVIGNLEPASRLFLVQHPSWFPLVENVRRKCPGTVLYDCMDSVSDFPDAKPWVIDFEKQLLKDADQVVVSSAALEAKVKLVCGDKVTIIRNAADHTRFSPENQPSLRGEKPLIGYYGSFGEWVDFKTLFEIAARRPDWRFLFIGPKQEASLTALQQPANVEFKDSVPYERIPSELAAFDVALIPFHRNSLTEAVNPVKVYEYLAASKPVAAVAIPELKILSDVLYLVENSQDLERAIMEAVTEAKNHDQVLRRKRRQVAEENSWDRRADQFKGVFERAGLICSLREVSFLHELYTLLIKEAHAEKDAAVASQDLSWRAEMQKRGDEWAAELQKRGEEWTAELDKRDGLWRAELEKHVQMIHELRRKLGDS